MQEEHVFIVVVEQQPLHKLVDAQFTGHVIVHDFEQSLRIRHSSHFVQKILKIGLPTSFLKLFHCYIFVAVCVGLFEQLFKLLSLAFSFLSLLLLFHLPILLGTLEAFLDDDGGDQIHQCNPCQQRESIKIDDKPPLLQDDRAGDASPRVKRSDLNKGDHCSPNGLKVSGHQVLNDWIRPQRLVIVYELFSGYRKHEKHQAHQYESPDKSHYRGKQATDKTPQGLEHGNGLDGSCKAQQTKNS
mmetsp:Transcript_3667/g.8595  ORF Transcript_3667/g.8595 Transcript_3667/m.8595 type:complete len:243 (-) Transcript_3667:520-1248(-)